SGHDLAEKIYIGGHISLAQAIFGQFHQKTFITALLPLVAILLIVMFAPFFFNACFCAVAANSFVPTQAILDNAANNTAHIGRQAMTLCEFKSVLALQGIRRVVTLQ